ncbi:MAG: sugar ABC transporter substrate-binding protein, partial [Enterococcus casseliflavus]
MKVNWKKAALGLVSGSALLALAACGGNGGSTDGSNADAGSGSDEKTITVSVGADYIDYINEVKSDFESENDVTINVVEMDMFDQMDAL